MQPHSQTVRAFPLVTEAEKLAAADRLEDAAQALIRHLRQHPEEPRGMAKLGQVAMRLGALGQAEHFLRKALARGQNGLEARSDLASVISMRERADEAERLYALLAQETGDNAMLGTRAALLEKLGRHEEALTIKETLAAQEPENPFVWTTYGNSLRAAGRVDEAIAAYRKAVALDYEFGEGWWSLASIKRRVLTDEDIAEIRRGLDVAIDVRNISPLHFAMGKALHDRQDWEGAFHHYAQGNHHRAQSLGYDPRELTEEVDETIAHVGATRLDWSGSFPADAGPVFIVSLPRSGSTLLEQMVGSHPKVEPVGELPYIPALLRGYMEMATRQGPVTVPQAVAMMPQDQADAIGREYLRRVALHRKTDRPLFLDKLPHNWSNVLFIRRILPNARFLDIRRPAMDCCFSNFTQSFTRAHAASFDLAHMGQCYADYVRFMAHLGRVAPGMVHPIDYTALVEDARSQLEPLLAYLGLPWAEELLRFDTLDRVVRTPSSEQVRRPLNRDGMGVWQPYAQWLGPLREALGDLT